MKNVIQDKQKTFYIETLGCAKNAVDSEKAIAGMIEDGLVQTTDPTLADVVVVNTCAFIDQAREESINTTLALGEAKKTDAQNSLLPAVWHNVMKTN